MPNKPTDSEIVKALECCIKSTHFGECFENKCPFISEQGCKVGKETLYPYALDLINRLQATIEDLNIRLSEERNRTDYISKSYNEIKAEAYKEFAERLCKITRYHPEFSHYCIQEEKFDNLLKELAGEDNES